MKLIGLTGSIGMGKTTTARFFRDYGIPVFDADAEVHALQSSGGQAIPLIEKAFPGMVVEGDLDRKALGDLVFSNNQKRMKLEKIIHPLVAKKRSEFLNRHRDACFCLFDMPLLFETGADQKVDKVIVVTAPLDVQYRRVTGRSNMTEKKFLAINSRQVPDRIKRKKADFIIDTSTGLDAVKQQVAEIIKELKMIYA